MAKPGNLTMRIIVALFGIPLIIILCIVGKVPFLIFALVIGVVSFFEFHKMLSRRKFIPNVLISSASVIAVILNSYLAFIDFYTLALIVVSVLLLAELSRNRESAIANVGTSLIGIFYIGLFSSSLVKLRDFYSDSFFLYDQGGYLIVSIFASIWICDSAAYFVGSAIGKHKILPRISPHKSWEGAIAGLIFSIAAMIATKNLIADFLSMQDAVVIGIITGTIGQAGDFVESMLKRDANVKDSSSLIPGHGGIFDRFDSLLFTAPAVYLYLTFTNII